MSTVSSEVSKYMGNAVKLADIWGSLIYNVKAPPYGAKGNNITADTTAIQKAIDDAAVSGGVVVLPPGTYITGSLSVPSNVTLWFPNGAKLSVNSGAVITINGPIMAEISNIFTGAGSVQILTNNAVVYPQWFGATGTELTNDAPAINKAIAALPGGGTVSLPKGTYKLEGTGTELILITRPITFTGSVGTTLVVAATVPATTDIIRVNVPAGVNNHYHYIGNLNITGPSPTVAYGRHGIHLDCSDPNQHISKMTIEKVEMYILNGNSIKLTNPSGNDAYFTSVIQDCELNDGINLERAGDSINIQRNTITNRKTGIKATMVVGAATFVIENNNITSKSGAIDLANVEQVKIIRNQMETPQVYDGTRDAVVYLENAKSCEVTGNNMNAVNRVSFNLRITGTSDNNRINGNVMTLPNMQNISLEAATVTNTYVEHFGQYTNNVGVVSDYANVLNLGVKTIGVQVQLTLVGGATAYDTANFSVPAVKRHSDGQCELFGAITPSAITAGTQVSTMPVGFRPIGKSKYVGIPVFTSTGPGMAVFTIAPTGEFSISNAPTGTTRLVLDGVTFSLA